MACKYAENEEIITAFLENYKVADIARVTKLSRTTVRKIRDDPDFQKVLRKRKSEIVAAAVNKMQSHLVEYVSILQSIAYDENNPPQVRVNALQVLMNQLRDWTTTADLEARVEALEDSQN